jgi:ADP-ribose pyrophosphatase YjhB (NUDIX family)
MTFQNPMPVAVALTPVISELDNGIIGLLMVERTLAPTGLALPGGFVDVGETHQMAAAREVKEETGLDVMVSKVETYAVRSAVDSNTILMFVETEPVTEKQALAASGSNETARTTFIKHGETKDIVFPLHREVCDQWFDEIDAAQERARIEDVRELSQESVFDGFL